MNEHSAAIRLTTSSGVNIDAITATSICVKKKLPARMPTRSWPVLSVYRQRPYSFSGMIPKIDIWRAAQLMLQCYGDNGVTQA